MPRASRSHLFSFTFFNFNPETILSIKAIDSTWLIAQTEVTPTNKTIHLQGAIHFNNALSRASARKRFPLDSLGKLSVHIEIAIGSSKQNRDYCTKEETRSTENYVQFETGTIPTSGKRSDLATLLALVKASPRILETDLFDLFPQLMIQYGRRVLHYRSLLLLHSSIPKKITVLWGPTGTGKSHAALARACSASNIGQVYYLPTPMRGGPLWADGYHGQTDVILEDFSGSINYRMLLRMLDHYPLSVPIKGGFVPWIPTRIWITSNQHPKDWYPILDQDDSFEMGPLHRRLNRQGSFIVHMDKKFVVTAMPTIAD